MAHDLIHIAVLHSGDSATKAAFARMDIGFAEVTLGLGAVVSKLLNGCLKAQRIHHQTLRHSSSVGRESDDCG